MGLDVYLYTHEQHINNELHEAQWSALWDKKENGEVSDEEYKVQKDNITDYKTATDVPSEKYPDHLFNRRYLRSSYNSGGFNNAVPDFLGTDGSLYWIFEPVRQDSEEYDFTLTRDDIPALEQCKARALEVAEKLKSCDPLRAEAIHGPALGQAEHMWSKLPSEDEILSWYRDEANGRNSRIMGRGYSNAKGTVFGFDKGLEVLAITLGRDALGIPSPVIVYRSTVVDSYREAAEITAEFCDEAIYLINRDSVVHMVWSG